MKKHLCLKACFLLIVMFFHSFVLVPKANATTWEGVAGRLAFRAMAPSAIAALGSGTALVIGAVVAGGVGYLIYKSGAVTALKNWINTVYAFTPTQTDWYNSPGNGHAHIYYVDGYGWYWATFSGDSCGGTFTYPPGSHSGGQTYYNSAGAYGSASAAYEAVMGDEIAKSPSVKIC